MSLETAYPFDLYISGAWVKSAHRARMAVDNPSTGSRIADVADASPAEGIKAIDAAYAAAESWAATAPRQRSVILRRCYDLMMRDSEKLALLISMENGKALRDARSEVSYAAEFFRWFSEEAVRNSGEIGLAPSGGNYMVIRHQPIGVSILITPWNFPAAMATRKIAPALAAGCTCVLKPAIETPLTAYVIAALMTEAGVPNGVVNVVTTSEPAPLVNAILEDSRVRKLSFTGSTEVGKLLLRKAADQVISCSMELGGNAPFIVFDDADLDMAIEGVMIAKMRNAGAACTAANRIFVQSGAYDRFVSALGERMKAIKVGPGTEETTECGPLINAAAVQKVATLVDDAVRKGATVVCGGSRLAVEGHYYWPTVLANVSPDADVAKTELFGPVAPVFKFGLEHEAVQCANNSEYGLVAYVYTRDLARGLRVSDQLEVGMVALNRGLVTDPAAPFGGVKQSGIGREGGHYGMHEFLETKYVATDWHA